METKQAIFSVAAMLLVLALAGPAAAQGKAGRYQVTFQEISNSCTNVGLSLDKGTLVITRARSQVTVTLPKVPVLRGKARKGGKFKVAADMSATAIEGVAGNFSGAGRVNERSVKLILVAEYYRDKKALCTQSWDVSGSRK